MEIDYLPIQRLDVEAESQITFDVYVHLPLNQRYILYRRRGGFIEAHKLEALAEGNVKSFFIRREDYKEFVRYIADRVKMFIHHEKTENNLRRVHQAIKAVLTSTFEADDPKVVVALMNNLNDISSVIIEDVLESRFEGRRKVFRQLMELAERGTSFQKHPVNVASFAVLLTTGIGYSSSRILSDISVAALIHDIGLSRLPHHIVDRAHDFSELSIADRQELYQHPHYTLNLLKERKIKISPLAQTLILQHHEQFKGQGYPNGLKGFEINELAQILHVADQLDHLVSRQENSGFELKVLLTDFLEHLRAEMVIEPLLLSRIRSVLI